MKERVKEMHSGLLKQTSRSPHEHLAAFCINMFYKAYFFLSKICNCKWDLYPLKSECGNRYFFL